MDRFSQWFQSRATAEQCHCRHLLATKLVGGCSDCAADLAHQSLDGKFGVFCNGG